MTIARDLANVASLMASSSANVVFDDSIVITNAANNSVVYLDGNKRATSNSNLYFDGSLLSLNGNGGFRVNSASGLTFVGIGNDSFSNTGYITGYGFSGSGHQLAFLTGDTEKMRLTPTGLAIGKTTPNTALDVQGTVTATLFSGSGASLSSINATSITTGTVGTARLASGTANNQTYLRGDQTWVTITAGATLSNDTSTNSNTFYPAMSNNNTSGTWTSAIVSSTKFYFNPSTGTLNATVFNSLSDESLKENISTISNAVSTIRQLDGVSFTWKENGIKSYGVIAQRLEEILPELVAGDDKKTVNYSGIIAFLINSVKELDDRLRELESK